MYTVSTRLHTYVRPCSASAYDLAAELLAHGLAVTIRKARP